MVAVTIALVTTYLTDYRLPLYRLLAQRYGVEVLCYGGGDRYVPRMVHRSGRPAGGRGRSRPGGSTASARRCGSDAATTP